MNKSGHHHGGGGHAVTTTNNLHPAPSKGAAARPRAKKAALAAPTPPPPQARRSVSTSFLRRVTSVGSSGSTSQHDDESMSTMQSAAQGISNNRCGKCGIRTVRSRNVFGVTQRTPLTNAYVLNGRCLRCHPLPLTGGNTMVGGGGDRGGGSLGMGSRQQQRAATPSSWSAVSSPQLPVEETAGASKKAADAATNNNKKMSQSMKSLRFPVPHHDGMNHSAHSSSQHQHPHPPRKRRTSSGGSTNKSVTSLNRSDRSAVSRGNGGVGDLGMSRSVRGGGGGGLGNKSVVTETTASNSWTRGSTISGRQWDRNGGGTRGGGGGGGAATTCSTMSAERRRRGSFPPRRRLSIRSVSSMSSMTDIDLLHTVSDVQATVRTMIESVQSVEMQEEYLQDLYTLASSSASLAFTSSSSSIAGHNHQGPLEAMSASRSIVSAPAIAGGVAGGLVAASALPFPSSAASSVLAGAPISGQHFNTNRGRLPLHSQSVGGQCPPRRLSPSTVIRECGGFDAISRAMSTHIGASNVQFHACRLLHVLCTRGQTTNQNAARRSGAIDNLINVLHHHLFLSEDDDAAAAAGGQSSGGRVVGIQQQQVPQQQGGSPPYVLTAAYMALGALCERNETNQLIVCGSIEGNTADDASTILSIPASVSAGGDGMPSQRQQQQSVLQLLVLGMRKHPEDPELQIQAADFLRVVMNGGSIFTSAVRSAGCAGPLHSAMSYHQANIDVQYHVGSAIQSLENAAHNLLERGDIQGIVHVVEHHLPSVGLLEECCERLGYLAGVDPPLSAGNNNNRGDAPTATSGLTKNHKKQAASTDGGNEAASIAPSICFSTLSLSSSARDAYSSKTPGGSSSNNVQLTVTRNRGDEIREAGGTRAILSIMEHHWNLPHVQVSAMYALRELATAPPRPTPAPAYPDAVVEPPPPPTINQDDIRTRGGIAVLCATMSQYTSDPEVQTAVCQTVTSLCHHKHTANQNTFATSGMIGLIISSMREHIDTPHLQQAACHALQAMSFTNAPVMDRIRQSGGVLAVTTTMDAYRGEHEVLSAAYDFMSNCEREALLVIQRREVRGIVHILKLYKSSLKIADEGCYELCRELSRDEGEGNHELVRQLGGIHAVTSLMKRHADSPSVQRKAIAVIIGLRSSKGAGATGPGMPPALVGSCATSQTLRERWGGHDMRIIRQLAVAMERHPTDDRVQGSACYLLSILCDDDDEPCQSAARREGLVPLVVGGMMRHRNQPSVQQYGCTALLRLCRKNAKNTALVRKERGTSVVVAALRQHGSTNRSVRESARHALLLLDREKLRAIDAR